MSDFLSFHLSDDFVEKYTELTPDWGFPIGGGNSLSELTFLTKYSRKKEDQRINSGRRTGATSPKRISML